MSTIPVISQLKSGFQWITGDGAGANKTWEEFKDAWSNHTGETIGNIANGVVHLIMGDTEAAIAAEEAATRTLFVVGAGALTAGTGGLAAPILAGVAAGVLYDAATTGIESARHGKYEPQGYIAAGTEMKGDVRSGLFDMTMLAIGDRYASQSGAKFRTTKIYRVEGESVVKDKQGVVSKVTNRRLFPIKRGVAASSEAVESVDPMTLENETTGGDKHMLFLNFGKARRAGQYWIQRRVQYDQAVAGMDHPPPSAFNTQIKSFRILTRAKKDIQARAITEEAKGLTTKKAGLERSLNAKRPLLAEKQKVLNEQRMVLREQEAKLENLQAQQNDVNARTPEIGATKRAINEARKKVKNADKEVNKLDSEICNGQATLESIEARLASEPHDYQGILAVDLAAAPDQYGCVQRVYTPLLRDAIRGSYKETTPWLTILPPKVINWISNNPIKYGCVRVIGLTIKAGTQIDTTLITPSLYHRLQTHIDPHSTVKAALPLSQLTSAGIEQLEMRDTPVRGLRQCRHAKCGRKISSEDDHGQHFEYLVELYNGAKQWFWSELIALDLRDEFENLSREGAKEVYDIAETRTDGSLSVHREDGTKDKVDASQLFWDEDVDECDEDEFSKLTEKEVEAALHIHHHSVDYDVITHAQLCYHSDWAKVETSSPGALFLKDLGFHDSVYRNATFTEKSIMWGRPNAEVFESGTLPFAIVNHGGPIDISITHGRDADRYSDNRGRATVTFAGQSYLNDKITDVQKNEQVFRNCKISSASTPAFFHDPGDDQSPASTVSTEERHGGANM